MILREIVSFKAYQYTINYFKSIVLKILSDFQLKPISSESIHIKRGAEMEQICEFSEKTLDKGNSFKQVGNYYVCKAF